MSAIARVNDGIVDPVVQSRSADSEGTLAAARETVQGRRFLLDTYNIRLAKGSGIKTYGVTLAECLRHLGASVSLLGDRAAARSRHKALDEVLFYDVPKGQGRIRYMLRSASRGIRSLIGPLSPAAIEQNYVVPDRAMRSVPGVRHIYNVRDLFDVANQTYKRVGRVTRVRMPVPIDIWHATTLLPIRVRGAKMVTTIHDMIPMRLPYTTLDDKKVFYRLVRDAVRDSDLIITVSESTKRDIQLFFDVPDEKIAVTWQSAPFRIHQPNERLERATLKRYMLDRDRYLLFVGNIEPKKNLLALIQAAATLPEDLPLVVVGRKGWLWKEQLAPATAYFGNEIKRRFRLLDHVPETDLHALYANATCLVFPSLYEGFGLPPLEAMAHGCPVICSNVASLPEVCGDAALYVDPYEPESISSRIEELLNDERKRAALVERGYERLDHFSVVRYSERLAAAYARILD